ncbi:hypothetical protein [Paenibacillus paeoniae]|uniref:Uncharacterized protein n=1 Tax=Paenibacillus paeoniae TaxID=2292705 RepID=A0A371PJD0_9BACL|nr:hypothetical protein [Paenibacillus paeoniae]REK76316.1 hypothetical protein DX130_04520 [Paenibacillus paeoniae]
MSNNELEVKNIILNLLFCYSTKENNVPSVFELMSVEQALPYIKEEVDDGTYNSYVDWVQRYKKRYYEE